jgi:hypothetical protein
MEGDSSHGSGRHDSRGRVTRELLHNRSFPDILTAAECGERLVRQHRATRRQLLMDSHEIALQVFKSSRICCRWGSASLPAGSPAPLPTSTQHLTDGLPPQRRGQPQRFRLRFLPRRALIDPVGDGITEILLAPIGLCFLLACRLALRLSAGMLPVSDPHVRSKPASAYRTSSLSGRWHGDLSSSRLPAVRLEMLRQWQNERTQPVRHQQVR